MAIVEHRTKFIATLGPASMNFEVMRGLAEAGCNFFRCNFVHMQYDMYKKVQEWNAKINQELGTQVLLQADLQGPSIRMGVLHDNGYILEPGQEYVFITGQANRDNMSERELPINDPLIHTLVKPHQPITFMNGALEGEIMQIDGNRITVRMLNGGNLRSQKSVNVPDTELSTSLTEKDHQDLDFLLKQGVDWIALSFVSQTAHVQELKSVIGQRPIKVISKIERRTALENIEALIDASDAIMIARGDLGIELPMEDIPIVQAQIIEACHRNQKPAIVATQMMLSLSQSLHPTRAEVADVALTINQRVDAVMMSEETAQGIDPVNALKQMVKVVDRMETYLYKQPNFFNQAS